MSIPELLANGKLLASLCALSAIAAVWTYAITDRICECLEVRERNKK